MNETETVTNLKRIRLERGESLRAFAASIGSVSYELIRRAEAGRPVHPATRALLEIKLGRPWHELMENTPAPEGEGAEVVPVAENHHNLGDVQ